ncbi:MAG: hypothetical protein A2Y38_07255 [Spirochaetes bacterium GWB1_59_5]|nr:MAG: hypothetical protein A2Y38_07255 [Spirochaetes bacterium GWB1_59_5]
MNDPFDPTGVFAAAAPSVAATVPQLAHPKGYTSRGVPIPSKPKGTLNKTTRKAVKLVVEHGVDPKDAWELVNGKPASAGAVQNLKAKCTDYSLQGEEMQRLSHRVVKNTLRGKPLETRRPQIDKATGMQVKDDTGQPIEIIERQYPSHTNMLAAASMVHDRVDPIVRQNINLNGNLADFLPFELGKYR